MGIIGDGDPDELYITVKGKEGGSTRFVQARMSRWGQMVNNAIYSTQVVTQGQNSTVNGGVVEQAQTFPTLREEDAIALARANTGNGFAEREDGNYFRGGFPAGQDPASLNGVIFIDLSEAGSWAWVNLHDLSTTDYDPAVLIVKGNLTLSGTTSFRGLIYVVQGSAVSLQNDASVYGSILTTDASSSVSDYARVYFVQTYALNSISKSLLEGIEDPQVVAWKEYYQ